MGYYALILPLSPLRGSGGQTASDPPPFLRKRYVRQKENASQAQEEMKEKGVTVMIGLLGPGKKMAEKGDGLLEDDMECPLATQDEVVNKGNKQKAILTANYGPSEGEKMCGNCEYGEKLKGCGLGKDEVFCEIFEFKCKSSNVCDAWDSGDEED